MSPKGKVAVVTGGERGIGRSIVERLLTEGMRVCIAGIDTESAASTLKELGGGTDLLFRETDVRDEGSVRETVAEVMKKYGRLDTVIANAGIAHPGDSPVEKLNLEEWDQVIRTNLTGSFLCAKHSFAHLRKTKGSMVLIASTRALQSEPDTIAYSASKGGIVALTHALAASGSPDVRVNCISPGWIYFGDPGKLRAIDHSQHLVGRVGKGRDIAAMAAYLVSPDAEFITGQNFVVDGGMTKKMIYEH